MLTIQKYNPISHSYRSISTNGAQTYPLTTKHDGFNGETVEKKLFLRNDDSTVYYLAVTVIPQSTDSDIVITGDSVDNWIVKLYEGDSRPNTAQWAGVIAGDPLVIGGIGGSNNSDTDYHPFWIMIYVPKGTRVQNTTAIRLHVTYSEATV